MNLVMGSFDLTTRAADGDILAEGYPPIARSILFQITTTWKRMMKGLQLNAFRRKHFVYLAPDSHRFIRKLIEHGVPVRITDEEFSLIGEV